jgi:hypothetical protein
VHPGGQRRRSRGGTTAAPPRFASAGSERVTAKLRRQVGGTHDVRGGFDEVLTPSMRPKGGRLPPGHTMGGAREIGGGETAGRYEEINLRLGTPRSNLASLTEG